MSMRRAASPAPIRGRRRRSSGRRRRRRRARTATSIDAGRVYRGSVRIQRAGRPRTSAAEFRPREGVADRWRFPTPEARPDTGLTNPKLGIWLFLASEVMLFGSLFSSYRCCASGAPTWPPSESERAAGDAEHGGPDRLVGDDGDGVGVAASAIETSRRSQATALFMGLTLLGGAIFLVVKAIEYSEKFSHHLYPATNNFLGLYFTLTGLHAIHVIVGMIVNGYLGARRARCGAASRSGSRTGSRSPASTGTSSTWYGSSCSRCCICCERCMTDTTIARHRSGVICSCSARCSC